MQEITVPNPAPTTASRAFARGIWRPSHSDRSDTSQLAAGAPLTRTSFSIFCGLRVGWDNDDNLTVEVHGVSQLGSPFTAAGAPKKLARSSACVWS